VSPDNQPAIRLYESQGFVQESILPAYFGRGEDRIIMKKNTDMKNSGSANSQKNLRS